MGNEVLGFILMLRTEHKLKIDADSRTFPSSGFERVLVQPRPYGDGVGRTVHLRVPLGAGAGNRRGSTHQPTAAHRKLP